MGLPGWLTGLVGRGPTYDTFEVDAAFREQLTAAVDERSDQAPLLAVRPPKDGDGMEASIELFRAIHQQPGGVGSSRPRHAHEVRYEDGTIAFYLRPGTAEHAQQFKRQVRNLYPDASIARTSDHFLAVEEGEYVAGATLHLDRAFYFPIRSPLGPQEPTSDPYGALTSEMVLDGELSPDGSRLAPDECRLLVQTVFAPAADTWSQGGLFGHDVRLEAEAIREGELEGGLVRGYRIREAGRAEKDQARIVEEQHGKKAFYVGIRVLAVSPYQSVARRRCRAVAEAYTQYYSAKTEQGLVPEPTDAGDLPGMVERMATRSLDLSLRYRLSDGKTILTIPELAAVAHLPNEAINTPAVEWATQESGAGVPPDAQQGQEVFQAEDGSSTASESGDEYFGHLTQPGADQTGSSEG